MAWAARHIIFGERGQPVGVSSGLPRSVDTISFRYAEAVTRGERDRARQEAVYRAQEWTPVLRAVEGMPDGQAEIFELAETMYPPPLGAGGMWTSGRGRHANGIAIGGGHASMG